MHDKVGACVCVGVFRIYVLHGYMVIYVETGTMAKLSRERLSSAKCGKEYFFADSEKMKMVAGRSGDKFEF